MQLQKAQWLLHIVSLEVYIECNKILNNFLGFLQGYVPDEHTSIFYSIFDICETLACIYIICSIVRVRIQVLSTFSSN